MPLPKLPAVRTSFVAAFLALAASACASAPSAAPAAENAATQAAPQKLSAADMKAARLNTQVVAGTWLLVVDKADYVTSWDTGARRLQDSVPAGDWTAGLAKARAPFGDLQRRHFVKTTYTNKLKPAGHYVVVKYHSQFANFPAKESVTIMQEADNQWRVVMYGIEKTDTPPPAEEVPAEPQDEATEPAAAPDAQLLRAPTRVPAV